MNTEALQNDEDVRCAVEHFKAGRSIPTHILLKLKGNGNVHKRSSVSQDMWNNSAKRVKLSKVALIFELNRNINTSI